MTTDVTEATTTRLIGKAIKHPIGGGDAPALSLVAKRYLAADGSNFSLTEKAKEFLAIDYKPEVESAGDAEEAAE